MSYESELESRAMANDLSGSDVCRCGHILDRHDEMGCWNTWRGTTFRCECRKFTLPEPEESDGE